jgi:hypothetical protein
MRLAFKRLGLALRVLVPILITAVAAGMGYELAVYPIRGHVATERKFETLGGFVGQNRQGVLKTYYDDDRPTVEGLDRITWAVRTVMTPFVGYGPAPGQWGNAYIDRYQFRGKREFVMPKPAGRTRVFLTGASVAFSAGAPSDDRTIGGYLQHMLDERAAAGEQYEVFTFATPAWSSTQERIGIENRLSDLDADVVISLTGVADAVYGERGLNILWARALTDQFYWDLVNFALTRAGFEPMTDVQDVSPSPVPPPLVAARLEKNVLLASAALQMAHAHYHVFLQPAVVTTKKPLTIREKMMLQGKSGYFKNAEYYQQSYAAIDEAMRSASLPSNTSYTNLSGVFDTSPREDEIFLDSYHFGDRGNYLLAKAIVDALPPAQLDQRAAHEGPQ